MKRIKLNDNAKSLLMIIAVFAVVIVGTILYIKQIDRVNKKEIYVVCDCEMDK